ncbi:type IV secretion system protein [Paraburkholderia phymatum]|uniref:type IV secretion system protein n=1 Tax=Paraburkholderia phymatum TaxID=148447 RepID=UPI003D167463
MCRTIFRRIVAAASVFCAAATAHAQGVPTISPAELAQLMVMVQQLIQQVQNQEAQFQALTGNSGLGMINNNPALRNYLPEEWQDVYIQAKRGGLSGVSSSMRVIEQQEGMTGASTVGQQRYYDTLATNKAMNEQAYTAIMARFNNIQSLMQQSNLTQDPAQKADLQNRMAAEEAMVTNDQTRLQLTARLQEDELGLAQEQRDREFDNSFLGKTNGQ